MQNSKTTIQESLRLSQMVKRSLILSGYGTGCHVYDIKKENLSSSDPNEKVLLAALRIYESLSEMDRKIFIAEILERGRYYVYWYMPYANNKAYSKKKKQVVSYVLRSFYEN